MKPITKLNSYVFALTTSVVYYLWDSLSLISIKSPIWSYIAIFIFSAGFYKGMYKILFVICNHFQYLKKILLGKSFFEGTWIGFYQYKDKIRLYYEICDQTIGDCSIYGRSFDLDGNHISSWTIVDPYVNVEKSQFSYFYEINDSSSSDFYMGFANSTIIYDKHNKAYRLDGFAVDRDDSSKQSFISIKESDNSSKYVNNQKYLLERAREVYKNQNLF